MTLESALDSRAIFSLVGAVIGGLIGFASAWWRSKIDARRKAAASLRAAFAPARASVRLSKVDKKIKVEQVLQDAFPQHAAAIEEYRFYIKPVDAKEYQDAWEAYYSVGGSVRFFDYYMGENAPERFEERIQKILKLLTVERR